MSEKYPRAWGVLASYADRLKWDSIHSTDIAAKMVAREIRDWQSVELIPRPEHESIVAAAVAAAVERCAVILEDEARCDELSGFHGKAAVFREFAHRIREVPE